MNSPFFKLSLQWLLLISFTISSSLTTTQSKLPLSYMAKPRGVQHPRGLNKPTADDSENSDFKLFFYNQTLDHFSYTLESYTIFQQRYLINFKYWGGAAAHAPIIAYLGAESPIDSEMGNVGWPTDRAPELKALIVFIEHRYYGKSVPLGPRQHVMKDAKKRGYFTTAQALADYAVIIRHIKKTYNAKYSPVIVMGGSYGGLLAAWFRLKYPHLAVGALSSSASMTQFYGVVPDNLFHKAMTKDYRDTSETCYKTIVKGWTELLNVARKPNGLSILSKTFKTCKPLTSVEEVLVFLFMGYRWSAQYDNPPLYPVRQICGAIDQNGNDTLRKLFSSAVVYTRIQQLMNGQQVGNETCYINEDSGSSSSGEEDETSSGWAWQICSDLVFADMATKDTMIPQWVYNTDLNTLMSDCKKTYGNFPRPYWVTTEFGGSDIKLVLKRFGSNIIFYNGLRDPNWSGNVYEDVSDTIVAINAPQGAHCLDLQPSSKNEPQWLKDLKRKEVNIIKGWLATYYADLKAYQQKH